MSQWVVLFHKECVELWRNFKWVWVPLVFILLGMMQPVSTYYMPQILDTMGGLPDAAIIDIPLPAAEEVLASTLSQFNQLGIVVLVLAFMGVIAGERQQGVAEMVLVKPVSYVSYISAKWSAVLLVTWLSLGTGYLGAWYYTNLLIGDVSFSLFMQSLSIYGMWLTVVMTITVCFSTWIKNSGVVAFLSIISTILLAVITSTFSVWMKWSPGRLTDHANLVLLQGSSGEKFWLSVLMSILLIVILMVLAVTTLKRKEIG